MERCETFYSVNYQWVTEDIYALGRWVYEDDNTIEGVLIEYDQEYSILVFDNSMEKRLLIQ